MNGILGESRTLTAQIGEEEVSWQKSGYLYTGCGQVTTWGLIEKKVFFSHDLFILRVQANET